MTALICGSLAYDTIMVFDDRFKHHILPDKVHMLNVSFVVPEMRREFGGCAGNVAYNLKLLGGDGYPLGTVGEDFESYFRWLHDNGISRDYIEVVADSFTAQAYITSDMDDNQITAFHPGAMEFSARVPVPLDAGISIGIVSPDSPGGMISHARQFAEAKIPFIFDPGQALIRFDGEQLRDLVEQATWVTVNDYECELLQQNTDRSAAEIAAEVKALIVTRGAKGSYVLAGGKRINIPCARAAEVLDPTGCGDAFRAGLLYGLMRDMDWETTGRIAALAGAAKIEKHGTQNHVYTPEAFQQRFVENFGYHF